MALLRKELTKVTVENRDLQRSVARLEAVFSKKVEILEAENDRLRLEIAERDRRLALYENSNAPSSTGSLYNAERDAFRKRMAGEGGAGREGKQAGAKEGGAEPEGDLKGNTPGRGPPKGHAGASHGNKAAKTVTLHVCRCRRCSSRTVEQLPPRIKMIYDFPDDGAMRLACIAYVIEKVSYCRCGAISSAPEPTLCGTSLGPWALGFVYEYYAKRSTDATIAYYFEALYGFRISANAIWNARRAIKSLLRGTYGEILERVLAAPFVQFDESVLKMNGRRGYVWLVTARDAMYLVAAPSRGAAVLDLHFGKVFGIPIVVDGYTVYNAFHVKQRCWVHILRAAEKHAIRNGGNDMSCYRRLLALYRSIKDKESASCAECLDLEKAVLEIAAAYGRSHGFRATLEGAAPCLFMFLRHPGMPPHNNAAELEIRDAVVLHRNVRHHLSSPEGERSSRCSSRWRAHTTSRQYSRALRWRN